MVNNGEDIFIPDMETHEIDYNVLVGANCHKRCENLSVLYQNVRGLNTKITEFQQNVIINKEYDVIVITETWLQDNVRNSELFTDDYVVFRYNRNLNETAKKRAGGILVAVKNNLYVTEVEVESCDINCEVMCVKVLLNNHDYFYIFGVYVVPNKPLNVYENF